MKTWSASLPDHLWLPGSVQVSIKNLPPRLRLVVRLFLVSLIDDPYPPESRACVIDGQKIPYAREIDLPADDLTVRVYYAVDGEHVMVQLVEVL